MRSPFAVVGVLLLTGSTPLAAGPLDDPGALRHEIDRVVSASTVDTDGRPYRNAVVLVDAPDHGFTHTSAAGIGQLDGNVPMSTDHQFYVESITKTFTAVVALQLAEEGRLGERRLDATLAELKIFPPEVLEQLHRIDGISYGADITVGQLVSQRTGMKNFTYEDAGGPGTEPTEHGFAPNSFLGVLVGDPERGYAGLMRCARGHLPEGADLIESMVSRGIPADCDPGSYYFYRPPFAHWDYAAWKRDPTDRFAGLLNFYLSGMNDAAEFRPGEGFKYTDTNYLVLGLVIEKVAGNSLHSELRRRILDPLGMDSSYMSYATDPPAARWQRQLAELWALDGIPIVKLGINRSMMWSDAGLVSTVGDLRKFIRALVDGALFDDPATLKAMIHTPEGAELAYGQGVGVGRKGGDTILFHTGGAASWWTHHMSSNVTFIGTMNDATQGGHERLGAVYEGVRKALLAQGLTIDPPF